MSRALAMAPSAMGLTLLERMGLTPLERWTKANSPLGAKSLPKMTPTRLPSGRKRSRRRRWTVTSPRSSKRRLHEDDSTVSKIQYEEKTHEHDIEGQPPSTSTNHQHSVW